ncbi:unnamed protein product, partial [Symbiodinium sp. KB8]
AAAGQLLGTEVAGDRCARRQALRCRIAKHGAEEKEDAAQSPVAAAAGGIQAEATAEVAPAAAGVEVEDLEEQDGDADMGGTGGSARGSAQ